MTKHVSDETRAFIEEQFAECRDIKDVGELYADFYYVLKELYLNAIDTFIEN